MADYYYASLTIAKEDYEKPEVRKLLDSESFDEVDDFENQVMLESYDALWGEFEDLEEQLRTMKIPYNRYSSDGPVNPTRYSEYRPGMNEPQTTYLAYDDEPYVPVWKLNQVLSSDRSALDKLEEIERLVKENSCCPVSLLSRGFNG